MWKNGTTQRTFERWLERQICTAILVEFSVSTAAITALEEEVDWEDRRKEEFNYQLFHFFRQSEILDSLEVRYNPQDIQVHLLSLSLK